MSRQLKSLLCTTISGLFVLFFTTSQFLVAAQSPNPHSKIEKTKQVAFQDAMRKLWEDHIVWTRVFIITALADLPDKDAATQRLLQNQVDIGNAIKPYYGDAAGNQLTTLLKEHITTAAEIMTAAKAGDKAKQDDATKRWFTNADQIAAFFEQGQSQELARG